MALILSLRVLRSPGKFLQRHSLFDFTIERPWQFVGRKEEGTTGSKGAVRVWGEA